MANGRKTRCDRWDARLTDEQVWRAYDVFRRSHWAEFLAWAGKELEGVRIPSRNSMYEWERDLRSKEAAHLLRQAAAARDEVGALAETAALDSTLVAAYKSMAAKAALLGEKDEAVALTKMALGIAAQQVEGEKARRLLKAERDAQALRGEVAEANQKIAGLLKRLDEAGKTAAADPAAVAAEVDKLLGRKTR